MSKFDQEETPVIRVHSNGTSGLLFEMFPLENNKLTQEQIENLPAILSNLAGVKVPNEDRGSFLILSNNMDAVGKISALPIVDEISTTYIERM